MGTAAGHGDTWASVRRAALAQLSALARRELDGEEEPLQPGCVFAEEVKGTRSPRSSLLLSPP